MSLNYSHIDPAVREAVKVLREEGVDTFASCQGGEGHAYKVPTIRFEGGREEGFRAYVICTKHGFEVDEIKRTWEVIDGEVSGPFWELTFYAVGSVSTLR